MLRNYLNVAFRNIFRQRAHSLISITVLVALITVSYQSLKAAFSNPIKALRYE